MSRKQTFWTVNLIFLMQWTFWAIGVKDQDTWLLENWLVFATTVACVYYYKSGSLSQTSYWLLLGFLCLHAVGAHYTYANVPAGFMVSEWLGWERNHYDRLVHFSFGLFLFYPLRDILKHRTVLPERYLSIFSVLIVVAFSSIFELIEWAAVAITAPELGTAYLGTQGDEWDAQKDHALCSLGGLVSWAWIYLKAKLQK